MDQAKFQIKAVATKCIFFLVQNLKRVGRDFTPAVPETFAMVDGRMGARLGGRGCNAGKRYSPSRSVRRSLEPPQLISPTRRGGRHGAVARRSR